MQANSVTQTSTIASLPDSFDLQTPSQAASPKTPFADLFQNAIQNVQQLEDKASTAVQGLLDGSGVDVHTAMIATGDADAAFELSLAVRNKAVGAFQQLMGLQF
ncbi:flagellar hook-basal body complex protein FliE [Alloacidobacterium dinghuense]|uniref:Flagellar hook-basal body complex protein FliE n=1 Tax=Alloacidobacterium dinghuense TaxID=2763107 RepID=A0A7G8BNP6_9BACT|nr:flagellar hook-basal body complex protein FliE [Alloacidobacterium dinghuense]QNI34166.1 flagellar hook-basal body complex protein FliE [Alloacidobacterium dinghuense]